MTGPCLLQPLKLFSKAGLSWLPWDFFPTFTVLIVRLFKN